MVKASYVTIGTVKKDGWDSQVLLTWERFFAKAPTLADLIKAANGSRQLLNAIENAEIVTTEVDVINNS